MADPNGALLRSLTGILQQAAAPPQPQAPAIGQAQAATALAELVAGLAQALGSAAQAQAPAPVAAPPPTRAPPLPRLPVQTSSLAETWNSPSLASPAPETTGPLPTVEEFVAQNMLESWCVDALYLLRDEQREHVMRSPLNLENTTNLNGVITSRIKEVAPVDQRLQMFIQLNGLAEGVVDRLGTLTTEQHEKVMESTLKIQKANNPSGVCMRRITDVLRNERLGIAHGPHMSSPQYRVPAPAPAPAPVPLFNQQQANTASMLSALVSSLTGAAAAEATGGSARERSRSRPPVAAMGAGVGNVPKDIQGFLDEYALDWWVGEVLSRLSLWQRQNVMTELENMRGVRNPSGVVMARVKQVANTQEMLTIFIDINKLDAQVADELWNLSEEQQLAIMAPGIYIQNARSPSVAARSRIRHVLAGNDAMGGVKRGSGDGNNPSFEGLAHGSAVG